MEKRICLYVLFFLMVVLNISFANGSLAENALTNSTPINLQGMSIEELLSLQSEVQRILADKGYVQYEELERGSKGDSVADVQQRLKELGYYSGSISGKYDSETQKAFKMFEKNNDLASDGKASRSDLVILFSTTAAVKATPPPAKATAIVSTSKMEDIPKGYLAFSEFDYVEYFRYPERYYGTRIVLKGRAVQVLGSRNDGFQIRLATSGNSDIVYIRVSGDPGFNILEDDRLTAYVVMKNTYTYIATFGNSVTIPSADADSIRLN